jgi:hypothetical protein
LFTVVFSAILVYTYPEEIIYAVLARGQHRLDPYAPPQMRHTYLTLAMEAGVDFQTATLLLNHANPHVSFNYVTKAHLLGHMRKAQEEVCSRLGSFRQPM